MDDHFDSIVNHFIKSLLLLRIANAAQFPEMIECKHFQFALAIANGIAHLLYHQAVRAGGFQLSIYALPVAFSLNIIIREK